MEKKAKRFGKDGFYGTEKWRKTRARIIKRDSYKDCPMCGAPLWPKQRLVVDHQPPRRKLPKELWHDPRVLQTMHWECHNKSKLIVEQNIDKPQIGMDGLPDDWR